MPSPKDKDIELLSDASDVFLTAPLIRHRYGGISDMALHRWLNDPKVGFPQPTVIGNRRYWRLSELQKFERNRVGQKVQVSDSHISKRQTVEANDQS